MRRSQGAGCPVRGKLIELTLHGMHRTRSLTEADAPSSELSPDLCCDSNASIDKELLVLDERLEAPQLKREAVCYGEDSRR